MAKHQLSQKDMGWITLFAISLCAPQLQAAETKSSQTALERYTGQPVQADKPKITFNLSKRSVQDLPEHIEKPKVNFLSPTTPVAQKENILVPAVVSDLPELEEDVTPKTNKLSAVKSLFSVKKSKLPTEYVAVPNNQPVNPASVAPKIIKPVAPSVSASTAVQPAAIVKVADKPKISFAKTSEQSSKILKPTVPVDATVQSHADVNYVQALEEAKRNKQVLAQAAAAQPKVLKPAPVLAAVPTAQTPVTSTQVTSIRPKISVIGTENSYVSVTSVPETTTPIETSQITATRKLKPKINHVRTATPAVSDQAYNSTLLTESVNADVPAETTVVAESHLDKAKKVFWPFKNDKNVKVAPASVLAPPMTASAGVVNADKPNIVYAKPIDQKVVVPAPQQQSVSEKLTGLFKKDRNKAVQTSSTIPVEVETTAKDRFGLNKIKTGIDNYLKPKSSDDFTRVELGRLSNFEYDPKQMNSLPVITSQAQSVSTSAPRTVLPQVSNVAALRSMGLYEAIQFAVSRHPQVSQSVSTLASQNATVDVAKAGYYPQISAGLSTGDMTSGERGRQLVNLNATQMLYDFGKVRSSVDIEQARVLQYQAQVLNTIDDIALQVANAIINIKRYEIIRKLAQDQVQGIAKIREITELRARAGISSQADPVQAQSYYEQARSNLILQESQLAVFKQRLNNLMGFDVSLYEWDIPESLIAASNLYSEVKYNEIPKMMVARAEVEVAEASRINTQLSRYPTINVKGSLSQAVNGVNPNNNKDDGTYSAIMLEASSNIFQGGATTSRTRAATYAEEAAKAKVNSVYLEASNDIRTSQDQIENKQRQMKVLVDQQAIAVRTRELYQEQYKLGTRSALDLLNAEQMIHSTRQQLETARYDIYENLVRYIAAAGKSRDVYQLNNLTIQGVELKP